MRTYSVYLHTNKINGKRYCGMSCDIERRWRSNGIEYKRYEGENAFYADIEKYGFDNFTHEVVQEGLSFEEACKLEKKLIHDLDLQNESKGYNIAEGGLGGRNYREHPRGMLGKPQTEYQKQHHKEWMKNPANNCMLNGQCKWGVTHEHPRGMLGKHHTDEHKKAVSEFFSKAVKMILPNGEERIFSSLGELSKHVDLNYCTLSKWARKGVMFSCDKSHPRAYKYNGYTFQYV